jgi:ATP-dependent DNA helicase RecG
VKKQEYKGVTAESKILLGGEEGYDVEFKRSMNGLTNEDLVAFANSEEGGVIFIGVEEFKKTDGRKIGNIVGCPIGDEEKLKIIDRAMSCVPPIDINVTVENTCDKPIFRIDIPSGRVKPYCTSKGTYKIRGDGRNLALTPDRLLDIFMEKESQAFINRFKNATHTLEQNLDNLISRTEYLDIKLDGIEEGTGEAISMADEATSLSEQAADGIGQVYEILDGIQDNDLYFINVDSRI